MYDYALLPEFQERGSPYVHASIWILNASNVGSETGCPTFNERNINVNLPGPLEQPELFELAKLYQIHSH